MLPTLGERWWSVNNNVPLFKVKVWCFSHKVNILSLYSPSLINNVVLVKVRSRKFSGKTIKAAQLRQSRGIHDLVRNSVQWKCLDNFPAASRNAAPAHDTVLASISGRQRWLCSPRPSFSFLSPKAFASFNSCEQDNSVIALMWLQDSWHKSQVVDEVWFSKEELVRSVYKVTVMWFSHDWTEGDSRSRSRPAPWAVFPISAVIVQQYHFGSVTETRPVKSVNAVRKVV